jgi:transposase
MYMIDAVSIDNRVKEQVFKQWLSGDSRDKIAADNRIGAGTVTNIVNEWRKRLDDFEFDEMRNSMVFLKKTGN